MEMDIQNNNLKYNFKVTLAFMLVTVLLDGIVLGIALPSLPQLVSELSGRSMSDSAVIGGVMTALFAAVRFVFSPLVGSLSDALGRRPILIASLFFMLLEFIVLLVASHVWMLLFARAIGGVGTANRAVIASAIADSFDGEQRTRYLGLQTSSYVLGVVLGPLIGGIAGSIDLRLPFFIAAGVIVLNLILGIIFFRDTLPENMRRPFTFQKFTFFAGLKINNHTQELRKLLVSFFFYNCAFVVLIILWPYYSQSTLGWSKLITGMSLSVFGVSLVFSHALAIKPLINRLGSERVIRFCLIGLAVVTAALSVSNNVTILFIFLSIIGLFSIAEPILQSQITFTKSQDEQGEIQGQLSSLRALATIVSSIVFPIIYAFSSGIHNSFYFPGLTFILCGVFFLFGWAFILITGDTGFTLIQNKTEND